MWFTGGLLAALRAAGIVCVCRGQKLYSVFVKESFKVELITDPLVKFDPGAASASSRADDHFYPYAKKDNQIFRTGDPAGLFIMYRVEVGTPDSDEGWVYATVNTERQVTASGRIDSCMGCHVKAPHGRLFGVPSSPHAR